MPEKLMKRIDQDDFESGLRLGGYCAVYPTTQGPYPSRSGFGCPLVVLGRDCQNEPLDANEEEVSK